MTALKNCPMSELSVSRLSLMKWLWVPELIINVTVLKPAILKKLISISFSLLT